MNLPSFRPTPPFLLGALTAVSNETPFGFQFEGNGLSEPLLQEINMKGEDSQLLEALEIGSKGDRPKKTEKIPDLHMRESLKGTEKETVSSKGETAGLASDSSSAGFPFDETGDSLPLDLEDLALEDLEPDRQAVGPAHEAKKAQIDTEPTLEHLSLDDDMNSFSLDLEDLDLSDSLAQEDPLEGTKYLQDEFPREALLSKSNHFRQSRNDHSRSPIIEEQLGAIALGRSLKDAPVTPDRLRGLREGNDAREDQEKQAGAAERLHGDETPSAKTEAAYNRLFDGIDYLKDEQIGDVDVTLEDPKRSDLNKEGRGFCDPGSENLDRAITAIEKRLKQGKSIHANFDEHIKSHE
jgi:hypothetical protein